MPRKKPKLIVAAHRVAEARRIVAEQHQIIAKLQAFGRPTLDAERTLQMYVGSLKHLEDYERKIRMEDKAKTGETKKDRRFRRGPPVRQISTLGQGLSRNQGLSDGVEDWHSRHMPQRSPTPFNCPNCGAKYKVVEVEAPSATADLTCVSCGDPLPARDGGFLLKYFLVQRPRRPAGRTDVLARTVPSQQPTG